MSYMQKWDLLHVALLCSGWNLTEERLSQRAHVNCFDVAKSSTANATITTLAVYLQTASIVPVVPTVVDLVQSLILKLVLS
jgi:hypothetical protein